MAVPARKTSKTKKRMRRGHIKLSVPGLAPCPNCGELRKSHMVCVQIVATTMASKLLILTTNINIKKDPFLGAGPERVFFIFKI